MHVPESGQYFYHSVVSEGLLTRLTAAEWSELTGISRPANQNMFDINEMKRPADDKFSPLFVRCS